MNIILPTALFLAIEYVTTYDTSSAYYVRPATGFRRYIVDENCNGQNCTASDPDCLTEFKRQISPPSFKCDNGVNICPFVTKRYYNAFDEAHVFTQPFIKQVFVLSTKGWHRIRLGTLEQPTFNFRIRPSEFANNIILLTDIKREKCKLNC